MPASIRPETFDNAALEARWQEGREILRGLLSDLHEETYLRGAGLIIAGRKPLQTPRAVTLPADAPAESEPTRVPVDAVSSVDRGMKDGQRMARSP